MHGEIKDKAYSGENRSIRLEALKQLKRTEIGVKTIKGIAKSHRFKVTRLDAIELSINELNDQDTLWFAVKNHTRPLIRKRALSKIRKLELKHIDYIMQNESSSSVMIKLIDLIQNEKLLLYTLDNYDLPIKVIKSIILRIHSYDSFLHVITHLNKYTSNRNDEMTLIKYIRKKIITNVDEKYQNRLKTLIRLL